MLSRMDQTWTSDNTNPLDRLFIQYGYLSAYPANTMVCWATGYDRKTINLSMEYVFDVAMQGVLGIGDNILEWNAKQKEIAKSKIDEYKSIRHLIQNGNLYRLASPFEGQKVALEYVSSDKTEAVVFFYNMNRVPEGADNSKSVYQLLLQGLNPGANYKVDNKNATVLSGKYLIKTGIAWPISGAYQSTVLKLKKQQ